MQVYYYKVLGRLGPLLIPGEGEKDTMLPGDTLQVGEAGHQYIQGELFPFKESLLLVGSTFLGEKPVTEEAVEAETVEVSEGSGDSILAELLSEPAPVEPLVEEVQAVVVDAEEPFPEIPSPGAKVSEVMDYLKQLERRGYTLEQLDEVKSRFSSVTIQREVEQMRQDFLEQSLTIAG